MLYYFINCHGLQAVDKATRIGLAKVQDVKIDIYYKKSCLFYFVKKAAFKCLENEVV